MPGHIPEPTSAVSPRTWPKSSNRWRIKRPILSRTSARSPPVSVDDYGDHEELHIQGRVSAGHPAQRELHRNAPGSALRKHQAELIGDGSLHLLGDQRIPAARPCPARSAETSSPPRHRFEEFPDPLPFPPTSHRKGRAPRKSEHRGMTSQELKTSRPVRPPAPGYGDPQESPQRQVDVGLLVKTVEILDVGHRLGPELVRQASHRRRAKQQIGTPRPSPSSGCDRRDAPPAAARRRWRASPS